MDALPAPSVSLAAIAGWDRCDAAPFPPGRSPAAGDLCIADGTAEEEAIMLLVRASGAPGDTAIVVPVIADVEIADDEVVVVPADLSPTGWPVAVYNRLRANIPVAEISRLVTPRGAAITLLDSVSHPRAYSGPPVLHASDPRLVVRQGLIDRLMACWKQRDAA